jgi:hypothetical protein
MQSPPIRSLTAAIALSTIALAAALIPAAADAAGLPSVPGQTAWIGTGSNPYWDTPGNWSTNAAPSGTVSELAFADNGAACANADCVFSVDDIPQLTVGTLAIDAGQNYLIVPMSSADSLTLGTGIVFQGAASQNARLVTNLNVPITLAAKQTWTLAGVPGTGSQLRVGPVSGTSFPLTLDLASGTVLATTGLDTGPLTIVGGGTVALSPAPPGLLTTTPPPPPSIIASPGVTLERGASVSFDRTGTLSGPITIARGSGSTLQVGTGKTPDSTVTMSGDLTLRAAAGIAFSLDSAAAPPRTKPAPGTDYSQLTATGNVHLNSSALVLSQGFVAGSGQCAALKGGQVYKVISSFGKVDGKFSGIANGQVVPIGECGWPNTPSSYAAIIRYQARAVTATVIGTAQIKALVTQTLTATNATIPGVLDARGYVESFDAPIAGILSLTWSTKVHGKRVIVASATNTANRVGPRQITLKLTNAGRTLLGRSGRATLTATADFTPTGQKQLSVSRVIKLP